MALHPLFGFFISALSVVHYNIDGGEQCIWFWNPNVFSFPTSNVTRKTGKWNMEECKSCFDASLFFLQKSFSDPLCEKKRSFFFSYFLSHCRFLAYIHGLHSIKRMPKFQRASRFLSKQLIFYSWPLVLIHNTHEEIKQRQNVIFSKL